MEKKEQRNTGLSSGFLLGVVVGVIVTLLLTTQKGKRLLKLITEEGMSKLSNWEDIFADMTEDQKSQKQEPKLPSVELADEEQDMSQELHVAKDEEHLEKKEVAKPVKRFFKGIPRHSVN